MTIYVDELRVWPNAPRPFERGSSHLTADTLEELHFFAGGIGLKRAWFQNHRVAPHYDLTPGRCSLALRYGAVFKPIRQQIIDARKRPR